MCTSEQSNTHAAFRLRTASCEWVAAHKHWREMMRTLIKLMGLTLALSSATALATDNVNPNSPPAAKGVATKDADNTDLNARDKNGDTLTPQKQANSAPDVDVLAAVRRAIVDDENLSTSAHNVKIVVEKGVVTLRGPVKSANEKVRVEELAHKVAGVVKVDNRLDIDTK
jgi:hyperosmotically inducible periplasmic protein